MTVLNINKQLQLRRFMNSKKKLADELLGGAFVPGKDYIITEDKVEAAKLRRKGFTIEEYTVFVCVNLEPEAK